VVRVAVETKDPKDVQKLVEGMKRVVKTDPCVQAISNENGEFIIGATGELHLEIILNDLREYAKTELVVSEPVVPLRETVEIESQVTCLAKSPNKHNRLFLKCEPFNFASSSNSDRFEEGDLASDIEREIFRVQEDPTTRAKCLVEKYNMDPIEAKKIWTFGPEATGPNMLIDATRGIQYLNEIKDSCVAAFQWASSEGVLCEEPMRGIKFKMLDVALHADAIHRGGGQIIPTMRRVLYGCQLTANPRLMEPIYMIQIQCPQSAVKGAYSVINKRRGRIQSDETLHSSLKNITAFLPVSESFGFSEALRAETSGQAFPQCQFDHWEVMSTDPLEPGSKANQIVMATRKRKGLTSEIPPLDRFLDKL